MRIRLLTASILALTLALAACGSDGDDDAGSSGVPGKDALDKASG
jgi:ABC-type glycerol-3-phosphate transport system substrate-binding protein